MKKILVTKEDIDYMKRVLSNLRYHYEKANFFKKEQKTAAELLDEEIKGRGISYDSLPSVSRGVSTYENELIITEASYAQMAQNELKKANNILEEEKIEDRLEVLKEKELEIYDDYFVDGMTLEQIAFKFNKKSKQWAAQKIDDIVRKMLEVEL